MSIPRHATPIRPEPCDVLRIWGGSHFPSKDTLPIGERWLYSLLNGKVSLAQGGAHDGLPLHALQLGYPPPELLVKIIDTATPLSVQVHPNDAMAKRLGLPNGKSEMWYILSSTPESYILLGLRKDTDSETIRSAALSGRLPSLLNRITPTPGDYFHVPAGEIHALGPGLLLLEVQQASDTTYRLYDWDRADANGFSRPLNLPHALEACRKCRTPMPKCESTIREGSHTIVEDPHFRVLRHHGQGGKRTLLASTPKAYLLMGVTGTGLFSWPLNNSQWSISEGELLLLPPHAHPIEVTGKGDSLTFLSAHG